jgi:hypothetical protein
MGAGAQALQKKALGVNSAGHVYGSQQFLLKINRN